VEECASTDHYVLLLGEGHAALTDSLVELARLELEVAVDEELIDELP
jgi:hypothetical protein